MRPNCAAYAFAAGTQTFVLAKGAHGKFYSGAQRSFCVDDYVLCPGIFDNGASIPAGQQYGARGRGFQLRAKAIDGPKSSKTSGAYVSIHSRRHKKAIQTIQLPAPKSALRSVDGLATG